MSAPQTRTPGQLKVAELKEELRKRGITPKGLKKDLIEKLEEVLRDEAQEHVNNTNSCNLIDHVPAGSNLSSPVVDSTQCYIPLPPVVDYANEGYNLPQQVADTKSSVHASEQVIDHTTPGDFERKLAEVQGHESGCILPAEDVDVASSMVVLSAFEPSKLEGDNHKEEDMEQSESLRNSSLDAVHASGGMYHEREEGADYDSTCTGIAHKPEYGNDIIEGNPVKAFYQDEGTSNPLSSVVEKTMVMDEGKCNTVSSVVEEAMKMSNANAQFDVDSVKGIHKAESDTNFDKLAIQISVDVGGQDHQKRTSEYQLEEQKKGYNLTTYGDAMVRMSNARFDSAGETESEAVTISEAAMGIDGKNEPRHNHDSEAVTVKEVMVETTLVVSDNVDSDDAQNQHTIVKSQTHDYEFEPKFEVRGDSSLKQNIRNNLNSVDQSVNETGETETKQNIWSFPNDKGFKLNETGLAEKETSSNVSFEPKAAECQYTSSHSITEKLKFKHRGNAGISDLSSCKRPQGEHNYSIVMDELTSIEPEMKGNASTCQNDDVSLSTISNISLEDMQQCEVMPDNKENLGSHVNQSHQSNLHLIQHDQLCELDPSMTEKGKQQTLSALEESKNPDDSPNQLIAQITIFQESEIKPAPKSELLEGNFELDMKMGKGRLEEQEHKTTELILEGEKPSQEVSSEKVKRKSEFPYRQAKVASDSPREVTGKPDIVMVEPPKTSEATLMDVDFEGQMEKKRKDEDSERRQEPGKRQRRWNSGKNLLETINTKPLTTDTLKDIVPQENVEVFIRSSALQNAASHLSNSVSPTLSKAEKTSFSRPAPPPLKNDSSSNGDTEKPRVVPPPLRSPTTSLKIERFVRPFTTKALKELLSETGTVRSFWMDQIKTHCYVTYSSVEEAIATRNALYNLKWPVIGGRLLLTEFVDPEEVKMHCEDLSVSLTNTLNPVPHKNVIQGPSSLDPQRSSAPAPRSPPMLDLKAKKPLTSVKDPEPEPEPPVYTLDDLFKKTQAKPPIYYLPLNEEQVAEKLAARSQDQDRRVVNKASIRA